MIASNLKPCRLNVVYHKFYTWTATIFLNDIGNVSDFLYTILYADDTSVLLNGKCYTDLVALLNSELEKLSLWL